MYIGNIKNSNIFHFIDKKNKNICANKLVESNYPLSEFNNNNKHKLCKLCLNKTIDHIYINNHIFYKLQSNIYISLNDIFNNIYGIIKDNGYIYIKLYDYTINYISINNNDYYLINNMYLYNIDNFDIFHNIFQNKIGKLLGPKMAIINKEMVIITTLNYNKWSFCI